MGKANEFKPCVLFALPAKCLQPLSEVQASRRASPGARGPGCDGVPAAGLRHKRPERPQKHELWGFGVSSKCGAYGVKGHEDGVVFVGLLGHIGKCIYVYICVDMHSTHTKRLHGIVLGYQEPRLCLT